MTSSLPTFKLLSYKLISFLGNSTLIYLVLIFVSYFDRFVGLKWHGPKSHFLTFWQFDIFCYMMKSKIIFLSKFTKLALNVFITVYLSKPGAQVYVSDYSYLRFLSFLINIDKIIAKNRHKIMCFFRYIFSLYIYSIINFTSNISILCLVIICIYGLYIILATNKIFQKTIQNVTFLS